jgi:multiple antibiotic resistance protein
LLIIAALLPVLNPLGSAPFFVAMTEGCDQATRIYLARRITVYSFALLLGSMLLGAIVLRLFGLSIPIVQVAGGAVVCSVGWTLLTADSSKPADVTVDPAHARSVALGRVFYPLPLPLTVDAGDIAVGITLGAHHSNTITSVVLQVVVATVGSALLALSVLLAYRYAAPFEKRLGDTGMVVVLRLSAFIALCIGVGICWSGIKALLPKVGVQRQ